MATIYNSELSKELIRGARIQVSRDRIPTEIAEKVIPVMEVNPRLLRRITISKTSTLSITGGSTIYTTPTNQDFYITNAVLSMSKDATCDIGLGAFAITYVQDGEVKYLCPISTQPILVDAQTSTFVTSFPIKVDRGTNILQLNRAYTVGNASRTAIVMGYIDESSSA
jgi:hypothetical protein